LKYRSAIQKITTINRTAPTKLAPSQMKIRDLTPSVNKIDLRSPS